MDVHQAIESRLLDFQVAGIFQFALSLERGSYAECALVMHATPCTVGISVAEAKSYLEQLGFTDFQGSCTYFRQCCLYKVLSSADHYVPGFEYHNHGWSSAELKAMAKEFDRGVT